MEKPCSNVHVQVYHIFSDRAGETLDDGFRCESPLRQNVISQIHQILVHSRLKHEPL